MATKTRRPVTPHGRAAQAATLAADQHEADRLAAEAAKEVARAKARAKAAPRDPFRRAARWVAADSTRRAPVPVIAAVPVLGEAAHLAHVPTLGALLGTSVGAFAGYVAATRRSKGGEGAGAKAATAISAAGVCITAFGDVGLGGPAVMPGTVMLGYGVLSAVGYLMYRADATTRARLADQAARTEWHTFASQVGLRGTHLLKFEKMRIGERYLIGSSQGGPLISAIKSGKVCEMVARHFSIPQEWVRWGGQKHAGQIWLQVFDRDPWSVTVNHPLLVPEHELVFPGAGENDVTVGPLPVGQVPESGAPLGVTVWDQYGAKRLMIISRSGGGKSVLLNNLIERLTACPNAMVIGGDLAKGQKDLAAWRRGGAAPAVACGEAEIKRLSLILDFAEDAIKYRTETNRDNVLIPTREHPLIVCILDEVDKVVDCASDAVAARFKERIKFIASKGRSEGVALILAGQRGTAKWLGGADVRALIDTLILGKVNRTNEVTLAAGVEAGDIPDMSTLGGKTPGAIVIIDPDDGTHQAGRTCNLSDLREIERLSSGRAPAMPEPGMLERLGDKYATLFAPQDSGTASTPVDAADIDTAVDWAGWEEGVSDETAAEWRQATRESIERELRDAPTVEANDPLWEQSRTARESEDADEARRYLTPERRQLAIDIIARDGCLTKKRLTDAGLSSGTAGRVLLALRRAGLVERKGGKSGSRTEWVASDALADEMRDGPADGDGHDA